MLRAVLFDLGDTLFDLKTDDPRRFLARGIQVAYQRLVDRGCSLPPPQKYHRRVVWTVERAYMWSLLTLREVRLLDVIRKAHRRLGVELDLPAAEDYARACNEPLRSVFTLIPGADKMLSRVRAAGYRIGLVSNTMMISAVLDEDLTTAGIIEYFDARVYSSDVGYLKPHPKVFQTALGQLGVAAEESMFVGDKINMDVKGAKRLGMTAVLVAADGRVPAGRYRPDHIVRKATEVPSLLPGCRA